MWTTVYKATRVLPDGRLSGSYPDRKNPVIYVPGETTLPLIPESWLYAFDNLPDAKAYVQQHNKPYAGFGELQLWLAQADALTFIEPVCTYGYFHMKFWEHQWYAVPEADHLVVPCPPGSVWCANITLKERLV